ncbi:25238_t:CDS:2, partial [Racocetra persica]
NNNMDTNYSDYITPTSYDYYGTGTQSEKSKYVYHINIRTGDNVASFAKNKTIYERLEGCDSEEQQELRDSSERFGFTRDVEVISSNETGEGDMNSNDKPSDILPMALLTLSDTLESIETNPLLERYGETNNGGELKYTDTIENIHTQLKKHNSVIKGDIDFYKQKNDIDEATLAFFKEHYAFVPDPTWLSKHKKTKKYTKKLLVRTNISTLVSNRPSKHTREIVDIENKRE